MKRNKNTLFRKKELQIKVFEPFLTALFFQLYNITDRVRKTIILREQVTFEKGYSLDNATAVMGTLSGLDVAQKCIENQINFFHEISRTALGITYDYEKIKREAYDRYLQQLKSPNTSVPWYHRETV